LPKVPRPALAGVNAAGNAQIIRDVLAGAPGPARDIVVLNAGAVLFLSGRADRLRDGLTVAAGAIDAGAARATLERLVRCSRLGGGELTPDA